MNYTTLTTKQLAELAKEASLRDPIDWSKLNVTEDVAYELMASNVLEQMEGVKDEEREIVLMATVTKLLVENFVLVLRTEGKL